MNKNYEDITEKEFKKTLSPFYHNYDLYIINYVLPEAVAFYLANGYSRNCLSDCHLINHINCALDMFNVGYNAELLIPEVSKILKIKYNLKIVKKSPLKFEKII